MARPRLQTPTPAELEVLKLLWTKGPSTVRQVMTALNERRERAYTSVMSLLNVMTDKDLVNREPAGRAFVYTAACPRGTTLGSLLKDLLSRAFDGSPSTLVAHLLDQADPSQEELEEISRTIKAFSSGEKCDD